jgi:hypothetical protein
MADLRDGPAVIAASGIWPKAAERMHINPRPTRTHTRRGHYLANIKTGRQPMGISQARNQTPSDQLTRALNIIRPLPRRFT